MRPAGCTADQLCACILRLVWQPACAPDAWLPPSLVLCFFTARAPTQTSDLRLVTTLYKCLMYVHTDFGDMSLLASWKSKCQMVVGNSKFLISLLVFNGCAFFIRWFVCPFDTLLGRLWCLFILLRTWYAILFTC